MLSYLINKSRRLMMVAVLASVVSGVCSVLLVAQINATLLTERPVWLNFLSVCRTSIVDGVVIAESIQAVLRQQRTLGSPFFWCWPAEALSD